MNWTVVKEWWCVKNSFSSNSSLFWTSDNYDVNPKNVHCFLSCKAKTYCFSTGFRKWYADLSLSTNAPTNYCCYPLNYCHLTLRSFANLSGTKLAFCIKVVYHFLCSKLLHREAPGVCYYVRNAWDSAIK